MPSFSAQPIAGSGIGLRSQHVQEILRDKPEIPWLEVLSDNYFAAGGFDLVALEKIRENYPITMHSVGLSLGSSDPLDRAYLNRLLELRSRFRPTWISEHLCWTSMGSHHLHDLMPLPYTGEVVRYVSGRIREVQDILGEQILIENVSNYLSYRDSELTEWEFVASVAEEADCLLLLDVNNIYVSARNNGFDTLSYLEGIPRARVHEIHLAGFDTRDDLLIDAHNNPVADEVWELYRQVVSACGPVPTLIEWDNDVPSLPALLTEARKADDVQQKRS